MHWQAFGVGPRSFSSAGAWRAGAALCALTLAACGGAARDGDRESEPAPEAEVGDLGNRVPGVFEFPEGGREHTGFLDPGSTLLAIDQTGVLWLLGCGGVVAVHEGQARVYDASSGVPEAVGYISVDANNRKWLSGGVPGKSTLGVLERGEFRTVLTSTEAMITRPAGNGVVWAFEDGSLLPTGTIRRLSPTPEATITIPTKPDTLAYGVMTDHDGAVWLTAIGASRPIEVYRWADGAWSEPLSDRYPSLQYNVEQDALWSFVRDDSRELRRARWVDGELQEQIERGPSVRDAEFVGFHRDGRQLWKTRRELLWVTDGVVGETQALPDDVEWATVGWNDSVYVFARSSVYRKEGAELRQVLDLSDFGSECR